MELDELLKHFQPDLSPEIQQYATDVALLKSRYIFTHRECSKQFGYCTHCGKSFPTKTRLSHNGKGECPHCNSLCTVKARGLGRKQLVDSVLFAYYEKSAINRESIVARTIFAVRDYSESYHGVKTQFMVKAYYLFEPGNMAMAKRYTSYWGHHMADYGVLDICKTIHSVFANDTCNLMYCCAKESIKKAVARTSFRYIPWEMFFHESNDMVRFFALAVKYPRIEYLAKCGFKSIIEDKLGGFHTFGAINWRGETLQKMLKLNRRDIKEIRGLPTRGRLDTVDIGLIKLFQISRSDGSNLAAADIAKIRDSFSGNIPELHKMSKYSNLRKIAGYIQKQLDLSAKNINDDREQLNVERHQRHYYSAESVLRDYRDYIADCEALEFDLKSERVLLPPDLHRAHQNTTKQRKLQANEITTRQIASRLPALQRKYCFETGGLLIRPAVSSQELIDEGKALSHCVGTYGDRYAQGKTVILVVREKKAPGTPFYTMEVSNEKLVQCRGLKNCQTTDRVSAFVKLFVAEKLTKQPAEIRISVAV